LLQKLIADAGNYPAHHSEQGTMGTQKYIQQEMKFTQRELEAAPGAPTAPRIDGATTLSNVTCAPSVCVVIDFFDARDRLRAGFEESSKEFEINRKASNVAAHRLPSAERVDRLEELLYWLLSAATLVYLLLCIAGR
jgi:hypothetical protein